MTPARAARTAALVAATFLVTMAVLLRAYVYPGGTVLPLEQRVTYRMAAPAATYLDPASFRVRTGVPVTATVALYGDPVAGTARTAVWVEFSSVETAYGGRIDYHERRTAFDRRTGLGVACCDAYVDDDTAVRQAGLAFQLPRGAEPRGYPIFDPVLRRQATLRYQGAETVAGLPVYRYAYTAGPVKVEDLPGEVPGRALGLPAAAAAARYVRITRTLWVEPESGLPVKIAERRLDTLRTADQVDRAVSFQADLVTEPGDVEARAAVAQGFRRWAVLVRDVLPAGCLVLLVVPALVAWRAGRRRPGAGSAAAQDQQQVPRHDLADAG
ncbi:hypothetical protein Sru01_03100 [Sphaerisporangium rufum]|uniref:DUF3068 domain-containing protein n=1 Tax=Sphaerisporangium rufum TaxID=1381558 RepID=A0A919UZ97_9ACTN|nr:DUF3068 domain-containing protein [Sphaerisporangium rufum]GII75328.1 hypothetical protein Sru01_03100 [Sphaerisporangium rufum]